MHIKNDGEMAWTVEFPPHAGRASGTASHTPLVSMKITTHMVVEIPRKTPDDVHSNQKMV